MRSRQEVYDEVLKLRNHGSLQYSGKIRGVEEREEE